MLENTMLVLPRSLLESIDYLLNITQTLAKSHVNIINGNNFVACGIDSRGLKIHSKLMAQFSKEVFRSRKYIAMITNLGE